MRVFLYIFLLLSITSFSIASQKQAQEIAKLSASSLGYLDKKGLESIIAAYLHDKSHIKALKISELLTKQEYISLYNNGEKFIFKSKFPQDIKQFRSFKADVIFHNEKVGRVVLYTDNKESKELSFTKEEKAWIKAHPMIKFAFMDYWPTDNNGNNIHTDLIKLLHKYSELHFTLARFHKWKDGFEEAKQGEHIHGIMSLSWSLEREKNSFLYTKAYDFASSYLIVRKENNTIKTMEDLESKSVYIKAQTINNKILEEKPLEINVIEKQTDEEIYKALRNKKEADALLSFTLDEKLLQKYQLKLVKSIYTKYSEVAIGVSHKHKTLQAILNKIYNVIPKNELVELRKKTYKKNKEDILKKLTLEEKEWLRNHPSVKVSNEQDWAPFNFIDNGKASGFSIEYFKLLCESLGIKPEFIQGPSWNEFLNRTKYKEHDVILNARITQDRLNYLIFTKAYSDYITGFTVRESFNEKITPKNISKLKIAVVNNFAYHEILKRNYPDIEFILKETMLDSLKAVLFGEADAAPGSIGVISYLQKTNLIKGLQIVEGENIKGVSDTGQTLHIGIRDDWAIFKNIINKAIENVDSVKVQKLQEKWFGLTSIDTSLKEKKLTLSVEEQKWLQKNNNEITMCIDPNWMPIEKIDSNNKHVGITKEIFTIFENRLDVKFQLIPTTNWDESLSFAKEHKCDILSFLKQTKQRNKFLNFTSTMYKTPDIIVTKKDAPFLTGLEGLKWKKVGVVKGYSIEEEIKTKYPEIDLVYIDNLLDGFDKISKGRIFAVIDTLLISAHNINIHGYQDLKIAGRIDVENNYKVGVRKDSLELLSIMDKAVKSLDDMDINKINSKWIAVEFEHNFDYTLLWKILSIVLLLVATFIYWNRKLAAEIKMRKKVEEDLLNSQRKLQLAKEKAEKATEAKSMFLARMSHEIRTPMNAILGMLYLTQKSNLNPIQENYLNKAKNAADSLLHVINDILDFSKIEAGKLEIESLEFDFHDMLNKVTSVMGFKAEEKGIELLMHYDSKIPNLLISDPVRLEQILINLISNAIKFTPQGEVVIYPKLKSIKGENITLEFCIEDSGIGISLENQEKLFKDFSQVDETTTRKFGGSGLGLAISKKLAQLLGGDIYLKQSIENSGSVFCFTIKCKTANIQKQHIKIYPESLKKIKTLIVDDNKVACNILSNILQGFQIQNDIVNSGEGALQVILQEEIEYDIVFLDYKLEGIDGIETYTRITQKLGEKAPKIIMVSAYAQDDIIANFKEVGIESFLTKPVHPSLLLDTILHTLGKENYCNLQIKEEAKEQDISLTPIQGSYILLVEDNEVNQEFAIMLLESNGLNVDVANDGLEALNMVQLKQYDLVLMDIQMPNMDGLEASVKIRELKGEYFKNLPIVALSAHAMVGDIEKSLNAGMNDHVTKPINPDKLFEVLLYYIKPKKTQNSSDNSLDSEPDIFTNKQGKYIDFQDGLKRAGNNQKGYLKVLKSFGEKYKNFHLEVREFIKEKNLVEAEKKTHEIKGVGGNIGANKLFVISKKIDDLLKSLKSPNKEQLESFELILGKTIEEIEQVEDYDIAIDKKEFNKQKVIELLDSIENNLEVNIVESEEALEKLVPYMQEKEYKAILEKVTEQIENFDTDAAIQTIQSFKSSIK